jgi:hypothetical protein
VNTFAYVFWGDPLTLVDMEGVKAYTGHAPPSSIPGGPWAPAGSGKLTGTFFGAAQSEGPRAQCCHVPDAANQAHPSSRGSTGGRGGGG